MAEYDAGDAGSAGGQGTSPPGWKSRLVRYLTYGLFAWLGCLILFLLSQSHDEPPEPEPAEVKREVPPKGYDPVRDVHDSAEAAKEIDTMLAAAGASKILSFTDVSNKDGHLIVHFNEVYSKLDRRGRAELEGNIVKYWNDTKWVVRRGWSSAVEFVEHEGKSARSHTEKP